MRATRRLVLSAAAVVALAWTAARGGAPTASSVDGTVALAAASSGESGRAVCAQAPSPLARAPQPGGVVSALPRSDGFASSDLRGMQAAEEGRAIQPSGPDRADAAESYAGSSFAWPSLDPVARVPGAATVPIEGRDPAAPRALVLWRIEAGRAARLASAESMPGGRVSFGEVALPRGAFELATTPSGVMADAVLSAPRTTIAAEERLAPQVEARPDGPGSWRLRVRLESPGGWLVVSTPSGGDIGRVPVPLTASALRTGLDLWIDEVGTLGTVLVTHEDPGSGRSAVRRVALIAEEAGGEGR